MGDLFPFDEQFTMTLYSLGTVVWNSVVELVTGFLVQSPAQSPITKDAYSYASGLLTNDSLLSVGVGLISVFFLFNMIGKLINTPEQANAPVIIFMFIKLAIAGFVIKNLGYICSSLVKAGAALAKLFSKDTNSLSFDLAKGYFSFSNALDKLGFIESILMCLIALIYFFAMISAAINLIKVIVQLYGDLIVMIPYGALAAGTMTGGSYSSQIAVTYLKSFIGKVLAASMVLVLMVTAGYMCPALVDAVVDMISATIAENNFVICIMTMLKKFMVAVLVTSSVAGVDVKIRNLGL